MDVKGDVAPEDEALLNTSGGKPEAQETPTAGPSTNPQPPQIDTSAQDTLVDQSAVQNTSAGSSASDRGKGRHKSLATPAVRHKITEHNLNIEDIPGTGKDGRVLKEDVQRFVTSQSEPGSSQQQFTPAAAQYQPANAPSQPWTAFKQDQVKIITGRDARMYDTMTKSLSIPHFLYTDTVDFTSLNTVRRSINSHAASSANGGQSSDLRLSALPFIIKAISLSFHAFPSLNAHLHNRNKMNPPQLIQRGSHDIGVAIDTPQGLIVPVLRSVQTQSIFEIAQNLARLSALARDNKLSPSDLGGATFTVSNIGSIGGTAVAPVIAQPQVAIVGIGKARAVPAFNEQGDIVRKEECVFSWSADHRVVDGATVARCAEMVRGYLESTERMLVRLR